MGISLEPNSPVPLVELLRQQKSEILNHWFERIFDCRERGRPARIGFVAGGTPAFPAESQNRFSNPVPYALREAAEAIIDALINNCDVDRSSLEYAMKIRAVQGRDASEAIGFIQNLKAIIRKRLSETAAEEELKGFESRIDRIGAIAMELFLANRSRIVELARSNNSKASSL